MVVTTATQKKLSLNDFLAMPETKPASEYIDGVISQKPMPKGKHSLLQMELASAIKQYAKPKKIALPLTELRCTFAGRSLVPDIAVMRWENLPRDEDGEIGNDFASYPDWVIEILSPDQSPIKVMEKIIFCLGQGTELGWLIAPKAKSISVFQPDSLPQVYSMENKPNDPLVMIAGFEDWQLSIADIFAWLKI